jgi:NTP pyrophosphatase (non-canonical NTP hydrolase)
MLDLKKLQKIIYQNKLDKWFNVENVYQEFCYIEEELSEAYRAYRKKLPDVWEELADVVIYLLWLAEMLWIDFENELIKKVEKNKNREYKVINWVLTRIKG